MDQKHVLRSIETFGKHVLPRFDKDPVHRTTRQREARARGAGERRGSRDGRQLEDRLPVFDKVLIGGEWVPAAARHLRRSSTRRPRRSAGDAPECLGRAGRGRGARGARGVRARTVAAHEPAPSAARCCARRRSGSAREMTDLVELTIAETGAVRRVAEPQQVGAVAARLASMPSSRRTLPDDELPPQRERRGPASRPASWCASRSASSPASRRSTSR